MLEMKDSQQIYGYIERKSNKKNYMQTCFFPFSWIWQLSLLRKQSIHCFIVYVLIIFDNPEGQLPMWATYLHTRAMFNIWQQDK